MGGVEQRKRFGRFPAALGAGAQGPKGPRGFARSLRIRLRLLLVHELILRKDKILAQDEVVIYSLYTAYSPNSYVTRYD